MSCADPNIQNQPRDDLRAPLQRARRARHTSGLVPTSNIEMRIFAQYAGDGALTTPCNNKDIHIDDCRGAGHH